jgi:mersacidin/lichenicidin family type 2 lantibiotic
MAKKHQKHKKQPEQQPTLQPTAPATLRELTDEELEQVSGGSFQTGWSGVPPLTKIFE